MAEGIAKAWIDTSGVDLFAGSAGVAAVDGMDTSPETLAVLERLGIGFEGRSKGLSRDMVLKADALFCMTASHQAAARSLVHDDEAAQAKIHLLDPDGDIPDPIGCPQSVYDELAAHLQGIIPGQLATLLDPS